MAKGRANAAPQHRATREPSHAAPSPRPCPDCGNPYVDIYSYENGWQHVECDECYYLGPGEGSKLQAIRSHNAAAAKARGATTPPASKEP